MKKFAWLLLAGCAAATAQETLPAAAAVLDRFVEVTGGKAAYAKHHNQQGKGTFALPAQGVSGALTLTMSEPGNASTRVELGGIGTIRTGITNGVVWEVSPLQGPRVVEGTERAEELRTARFNAPLHWRETYAKAETIGLERVGDEDCIKVQLTPKDGGHPEIDYYSRKSGLELKETGTHTTAMGEIPFETLLSDYRAVDGVQVPFKTVEKAAGQEIELTLSELAFNVDLPADTFAVPGEIQAQINRKDQPPPARSGNSPAAPVQSGTANPK